MIYKNLIEMKLRFNKEFYETMGYKLLTISITKLSSNLRFYKSINYSYIRSTETNITYNTRITYTDLLK